MTGLRTCLQVKPTLFNNPPPEHVFGYQLPPDPEGAREGKAGLCMPCGDCLPLSWPQVLYAAIWSKIAVLCSDDDVEGTHTQPRQEWAPRRQPSARFHEDEQACCEEVYYGISEHVKLELGLLSPTTDTCLRGLCSGLTTAKQLPAFRASNMITVKKFDHTKKAAVPLPSNKNAKHVYGMPSAFRTMDIVRNCGPEEPPMKHLIQVSAHWCP